MKRARFAALVLAVLTVAACSGPPKGPEFPPIRFTDGQTVALDVAKIELVESYRPPLAAPNVDHAFPVTPMSSVGQWARDRLRASGAAGRAEVIVRDASVVEVPLKRTTGVRGAFTTDQSERYDGTLEVELRLFDGGDRLLGRASAKAKRGRSVAEDVTLNAREKLWYEMTEQMIRAVDEALRKQIAQSLSAYVK